MFRFSRLGLALLVLASIGTPIERTVRAAEEHRVIMIAAKRFEFSPKQISVKQGETVTLRLTSEDVTHGLFSKPLHIDALIVPDNSTEVTFTPDAAGIYNTICDHFCGVGHGGMKLTIVVE
jgi:cytochrome c oxidase subunit 2